MVGVSTEPGRKYKYVRVSMSVIRSEQIGGLAHSLVSVTLLSELEAILGSTKSC